MGLLSWFKRVLGITFELNADDLVVFIVGPAGAGKSWFAQAVTKCDLVKPSRELRSSEVKVQAIRCELSADAKIALRALEYNYIVFVDTPSFLADLEKESEMERNTTSWLTESRSKSTRLGIIYVDRLANAPGSNPVQKHLNAFASTFPGDFKFPSTSPMRLHGILTHHSVEDRTPQEKINLHKDMFQKQFDKLQSSFFQGRKLEWGVSLHHEYLQQNKPNEAWDAVLKLFTTTANQRDRQG